MRSSKSILLGVRLTEKSSGQNVGFKYTFDVVPSANKVEIRKAVEFLFSKVVVSVNTLNVSGKSRRSRTAHAGRTRAFKKAIVTLAPGETIDLGQ